MSEHKAEKWKSKKGWSPKLDDFWERYEKNKKKKNDKTLETSTSTDRSKS